MKTINSHIEAQQVKFAALPASAKRSWKRKAAEYCSAKPHMSDASTFWQGLSARQVLACK